MEKEKLENQLEILKTCIHKLKGGKHIDNKAYNQLLSVIADFHRLIDFDCTICYDTGWYGGVSHDEKPCPICKGAGVKVHGNNETTDCFTCNGDGVFSGWIDINDKKPTYLEEVIVARPNKHSGNVDIIIGKLHKAKLEGQLYGRIDEYKTTFDDYWSFPGIQPFEKVTHWMPLPIMPLKPENNSKRAQKTVFDKIRDWITEDWDK